VTVFDLLLPTMRTAARTHLQRGTRDAQRLADAIDRAESTEIVTDGGLSTDTKDVLIRTAHADVEHKRPAVLADDEEAYWRVSGEPQQTEPGRKIWFARGDHIHAHGEITALEDGRIWFDAAHETYVPCLDDAPPQGFTYVEPLIPRLDDTEWSVCGTGEIVTDGRTDWFECAACTAEYRCRSAALKCCTPAAEGPA